MIHPLSRRTFLSVTGTLALGSIFLPYAGNANAKGIVKEYKRSAFIMGSIVTFTCYHTDSALCARAVNEALQEMQQIEKLMSIYDENSQLSKLNRVGFSLEVPVDKRFIETLQAGLYYAKQTHGAFDITIEPLMTLYGFRTEGLKRQPPTDKEIAEAINVVGSHNLSVDVQRSTVAFNRYGTKIDFGGIAVGYALDRATIILKNHGIESALINHSGDIIALGNPPGEDSWEIGIVDPVQPEEIITTTRIKDQALSTSGNYRNFIEGGGKRIGHLINPLTGMPSTSILSGTVIANSAIEADALSTGIFVAGIDNGNRIIQFSPGVRFIGIISSNDNEQILKLG